MIRKEFLQRQYELSVQAGMNQRYHQGDATFWWYWDTGAKIVNAVFAIAGAMLATASMYPHDPRIDVVGIIVASIAAITALALNVIPFGAWEQSARVFLQKWTDIREDTDLIELNLADGADPDQHLIDELKRIVAKVHRLCGEEPKMNDDVIKRHYDAEVRSRQPAVNAPTGNGNPTPFPQALVRASRLAPQGESLMRPVRKKRSR